MKIKKSMRALNRWHQELANSTRLAIRSFRDAENGLFAFHDFDSFALKIVHVLCAKKRVSLFPANGDRL